MSSTHQACTTPTTLIKPRRSELRQTSAISPVSGPSQALLGLCRNVPSGNEQDANPVAYVLIDGVFKLYDIGNGVSGPDQQLGTSSHTLRTQLSPNLVNTLSQNHSSGPLTIAGTLSQSQEGQESATSLSSSSTNHPNLAILGPTTSVTSSDTSNNKHALSLGYTANGKRRKGELDPINHEIYRIRQQNMEFDEVASIVNGQLEAKGGKGILTGNAVYSRYKRNGPDIAAAAGEKFKPCALDTAHGSASIKFKNVEAITGFDEHEDGLLVEAEDEIKAEFWQLVSDRIVAKGGQCHNSSMLSRRYFYTTRNNAA